MDKRAFRFDMIAPSLIPGVHCIFFGIALAVAYMRVTELIKYAAFLHYPNVPH
jgi:hypothetical protein